MHDATSYHLRLSREKSVINFHHLGFFLRAPKLDELEGTCSTTYTQMLPTAEYWIFALTEFVCCGNFKPFHVTPSLRIILPTVRTVGWGSHFVKRLALQYYFVVAPLQVKH